MTSTRVPTASAFLPGRELGPERATALEWSAQDLHEMQLLLTGDSVIDWHRLDLTGPEDVRRLLRLNSIDVDNPDDLRRLDDLRARAVYYLTENLGLRVDESIATSTPAIELPLVASSRGRLQRQACVLLKVMDIMYHLDARELRTLLSIPDHALYELVEQSIMVLFDELRASGVPVVEFAWSRKTPDSLVTKLLVKRETSAARVFDRLRFRVVVERFEDLLPTLHVMLTRFVPFNYVVPGQTVNSLLDVALLDRRADAADSGRVAPQPQDVPNEFSARGYEVFNFVADLPVRVDALLGGEERGSGNVVFVLAEFQIMDRATAIANEQGESSHSAYKLRQHQRVRERLLRGPRKQAADASDASDDGAGG
ncbi:MAG: TIGR04552 family protein [Deltaproteobacteria bacterium]|nr:TIGR04552 family protein [Deltaproteobacteria bacterium]MBK8238436.1 TIGR04552 family protein [Deltaproteobacteria bacterium]MBK8717263.1 TIGR04552 family protein [Deltaproteobacteria bacterium]MBP7286143.1 TIGR04552 family protein [Nannocystaceae bacterium]